MELLITNFVKLNDELGKDIYLYEKSESYLNDMMVRFPNLCTKVRGIFDNCKRYQGEISLGEQKLTIMPIEEIGSVDWHKACLIITSDYYKEAFNNLKYLFGKQSKENREIFIPDTVYYVPDYENEINLFYHKKYASEPLQNLILFRSGPHQSSYVRGTDFADNARALFEFMLKKGLNKIYHLVWAVKNPEEFKTYCAYKNVSFIAFDWAVSDNEKERKTYYEAVCLAKYIFFTDAYGIARNARKDQIRVQLWHGCGFKTRTNFVPCEQRYEYNIVIGQKYKEIHAKIYGLRDEQVLITGYPKTDWLFEAIDYEKVYKLGIPKAEKYIFWLPTFRIAKDEVSQLTERTLCSETGLPIVTSKVMLEQVNNFLKEKDMVLVIKLHPFQNKEFVACDDMTNIILLDNEQLYDADIQINQLLPLADALISDYSSAAIDFLLLNRPIAFTLDDIDEYENSRGFVFEDIHEWLPGCELYCIKDFLDFIDEIAKDKDKSKEKRERVRLVLHQYRDGKSCQRVLDAFGLGE